MALRNSGLGWLRHDKLKHIGQNKTGHQSSGGWWPVFEICLRVLSQQRTLTAHSLNRSSVGELAVIVVIAIEAKIHDVCSHRQNRQRIIVTSSVLDVSC